MTEQSDQREVWDSIYRVITGTLELMVRSAPDHEEARRRIALVRLDLAVCESALDASAAPICKRKGCTSEAAGAHTNYCVEHMPLLGEGI